MFEYMTLNYRVGPDAVTERSIMEFANDWGRGGWRLLQVVPRYHILFFEREVSER